MSAGTEDNIPMEHLSEFGNKCLIPPLGSPEMGDNPFCRSSREEGASNDYTWSKAQFCVSGQKNWTWELQGKHI